MACDLTHCAVREVTWNGPCPAAQRARCSHPHLRKGAADANELSKGIAADAADLIGEIDVFPRGLSGDYGGFEGFFVDGTQTGACI